MARVISFRRAEPNQIRKVLRQLEAEARAATSENLEHLRRVEPLSRRLDPFRSREEHARGD